MIFISYRKKDTIATVTHLYRMLVERFGADQVFVDFNDIPPGENWQHTLGRKLKNSCVLLAVIGSTWGKMRYTKGEKRGRLLLGDPDDWVRQEICAAIRAANKKNRPANKKKKIRVIVVLVDDARLPETKWNCDLDHLAQLQHEKIRNQSEFVGDVNRLCESLEHEVPSLRRAAKARRPGAASAVAGKIIPGIGGMPPGGHSPRYRRLLSGLERSMSHGGDSAVARVVLKVLSKERDLEPAVNYKLSNLTVGVRKSDEYFVPVSRSRGQRDWQRDFAQTATPMLVGVAHSLERSGNAQAVIIGLCDALAYRMGLKVIWPKNPDRLNDLTNGIYKACRNAKALSSDSVLVRLKGLTVVSRN